MVQSICGKEMVNRSRDKKGVTISDGCNGILYIDADSENTVTGEEKRLVRRRGDLECVQAGI